MTTDQFDPSDNQSPLGDKLNEKLNQEGTSEFDPENEPNPADLSDEDGRELEKQYQEEGRKQQAAQHDYMDRVESVGEGTPDPQD